MYYNSDHEYDLGGTVPLYSTNYITRVADEQLYQSLLQRQFCYILNARQMGKSSLSLRAVQRLKVEKIDSVIVILTEIGKHHITAKMWYAGILQIIIRELNLSFDLKPWLKERQEISPIQNFSTFIHEVLLPNVVNNIVIFFDEIDYLLQFDFKNDFFALIRYFYNQRAQNADYCRISFVLIGVASPTDLIGGNNQLADHLSPFNIGREIELQGFQSHEVEPLARGLIDRANRPQAVLDAILIWTGGQPILTQQLCHLVLSKDYIPADREIESVQSIVQSEIIDDWKFKDRQMHLRTIHDRVITTSQDTLSILDLYQKILEVKTLSASNSNLEINLRLSGLVVKEQGQLKVYNRIYEKIFDRTWINNERNKLCVYRDPLKSWLSSNKDPAYLLRGNQLKAAKAWRMGKTLDYAEDHDLFINRSEKAQQTKRVITSILLMLAPVLGFAGYYLRILQEKNSCSLGDITSTSLSKNKKIIEVSNSDGQIYLIKTDGIENCPTLLNLQGKGKESSISATSFDNNNKEGSSFQLATGRIDGSLNLLKINDNGELVSSKPIYKNSSPLTSVSFSPDSLYIATSSIDGKITIINTKKINTKYPEFKMYPKFKKPKIYIKKVNFSADSKKIIVASTGNIISVWDWKDKNSVPKMLHKFMDVKTYALHLYPNPKKTYLVLQNSNSKRIEIFDLDKKIKNPKYSLDNEENLKSLEFSPDGNKVAINSLSPNQKIRIWSFTKDKQKTEFLGSSLNMGFSFSSDSNYLAFINSDLDLEISKMNDEMNDKNNGKTVRTWQIDTTSQIDFIKIIESKDDRENKENKKWKILVKRKGNIELFK